MPGRDEAWEQPGHAGDAPEVTGSDADLARAVAARPGACLRFRPGRDADIARSVGLASASGPAAGEAPAPDGPARELAMDALQVEGRGIAANMAVLGVPPDRLRWWHRAARVRVTVDGDTWWAGAATTVVVATGQWLRGADVVPRGHPGDGAIEVQVYAVRARERRALRARLATGDHVPHPAIRQRSVTHVLVESGRRLRSEVDGVAAPRAERLAAGVIPAAYRLAI